MKNLKNYSINKKNVLFRADLNIPVIDGKITDNSRIQAIKPSIKKLLKQQKLQKLLQKHRKHRKHQKLKKTNKNLHKKKYKKHTNTFLDCCRSTVS